MHKQPQTILRVLGCGSSGGVPRLNGDWGVCNPANPKNRRTRCSALVSRRIPGREGTTQVLIDTSPDMREQLLSAQVRRLDAVLYTHDHADQVHGIDDLRVLAYTARRRLPVHMDVPTFETLNSRFGYCFEGAGGYPAILEPLIDLDPGVEVSIDGPGGPISFLCLEQDHGRGVRSLGFRIGNMAYCNDVVGLPDHTLDALKGVRVLIVDALRFLPHPTHAHLELALEWIERVKPERALLTNLHIDMDYEVLCNRLPEHIRPAYDGIEIAL